MFWWYRHTRTWIISIYPSLSLFSFFFFLTLTHSWRLKAFYKMNSFSQARSVYYSRSKDSFFLFTHLLRGFFLLSVIVIMFWYSFFFYTMPSSSFLHFCRTFLLLLLFKFIILCQRHDIDESNKKREASFTNEKQLQLHSNTKNMFQTGLYTLS